MKNRNFISTQDFSPEELELLIMRAREFKNGAPRAAPLAGKSVALVFLKPSLRTRTTMELAVTALGGTPVTIHRYVKDCDAIIDRAVKAGATTIMPAEDMFWGDRYGLVKDPFGHHWALATHIKDMTSAEMAQAGKDAFAHMPG